MLLKKITERNLKRKGKVPIGIGIQSSYVAGIEAPISLRGKSEKRSYSTEELRSSIVEDDLDIEIIEETWNEYKLEDKGTIKIKSSPINVSRTNKLDKYGIPIYLVNSSVDMKIDFKK